MRSKLIGALLVSILLAFGLWNQHGKASSDNASAYEYQVLLDNPMGGNLRLSTSTVLRDGNSWALHRMKVTARLSSISSAIGQRGDVPHSVWLST